MSEFTAEIPNGFESLVEYIKGLPPLPESVRKIQQLFAEGTPDTQALVSLIESDPVLTADILARVNSPYYSFSNNIVSITQAVTLLGLAVIRGLVLESAINKSFEIDMTPYNISNEVFSKICNLQSALMFQWYMSIDIEHVKLLAPVAFMMEVGKVVIATEVNRSAYLKMFQEEIADMTNINETEKMFTDLTSSQVAALLFEHWHFDEMFVSAMRYMDNIEEAPDYVQVYINALRVVRTAVNIHEQLTEASITRASKEVERLGFNTERFIKTAERLREKHC